jgi:hypothetical protein
MTQLIDQTVNDIRGGRETWRVLLFVCTIAFAVAFTIGITISTPGI